MDIMKKRFIIRTIMVFLFMSTNAFAYDVEVGGIYYNLNLTNKTAEVTNKGTGGSPCYSESINIPSSVSSGGINYAVKSIGTFAFSGCSNLSSIVLPNSIQDIGCSAFAGCKKLSSFTIPDGITTIREYTFMNCTGLKLIKIPDAVTSIGDYAFNGCSALESISFSPNITIIGGSCFSGCKNLTSIVIPDKVTTICDYAFSNCSSFTSIVIPNNVNSINNCAFSGCSSLSTISIGSSVSTIGLAAFASCPKIADVYCFAENVPSTRAAFEDSHIEYATLHVPSSAINNYKATAPWSNFKEIVSIVAVKTYELTIKAMGYGTALFSGTTIKNNTSSFNIDEGSSAVITLSPDNGYRIKSVKVNGSTATISNNQFTINSIGQNTTVEVEFTTVKKGDIIEMYGLSYLILSDYQVEITQNSKYQEYSGELNMPEKVKYDGVEYDVTSIGNYAFYNCSGFTGSLMIPNSVTSIGDYAFCNCRGFTGSLAIPNSVTDIGEKAFSSCKGFSGALVIPNSVKSIGAAAFLSCNGFTGTLTIPSSVTSIGDYAFFGCSGFTGSLAIPNSVTSIGNSAFANCSGLSNSLTIPNSVTSIGANAFANCSGIDHVISEIDNPFSIFYTVFSGISSSAILEVPKGTKSKYQTLSAWTTNFKEVIEFDNTSTYTLIITASGNGSATYNSTTIRNKTTSFTVNEGTSAKITFSSDNGYQIKSVKVNGSIVTVSDNKYTISSINRSTTIEVEFEAAPEDFSEKDFSSSGNGTETVPYVIDTDEQWIVFAKIVNSGNRFENTCFVLGNNIDLSGQEYLPVGNLDNPFSGIFDGKNKTISNIKLEGDYAGLFGHIKNAKIANLVVNGIAQDENGGTYMGGLVGYAESSYINNVIVDGRFTSENNSYVGGIVGYAVGKTELLNCKNSIRVMGKNYVGGIVGYLSNGCNITNSMNKYSMYNYGLAGGVVGYNKGKINNCYSTSSMNGTQTQVGGVVGANDNEGIIDCCYYMKQAPVNSAINYYGTYDKGTSSNCSSFDSSGNISGNAYNGQTKLSNALRSWVTHHQTSDKLYRQFQSSQSWPDFENGYYFPLLSVKYNLIVKVTGYGSALYNGTTIRNNANSFVVNDGSSATITFSPDNGYRIKSVKVNNTTVSVSNNQYTISSISSDTTVEVEFEAIPIITYTLSISASGNGSATYNGTTIRGKTSTFNVNGGTNVIISFSPDNGYRIKSVKLNSSDVTSYVSNNSYTISNITKNCSLEVEFAEELKTFTIDGINYSVVSYDEKTIIVGGGNFGNVLEVPATITYQDISWKVVGIDNAALADKTQLAAIIWNPAVNFDVNVSNPNLLLYVTSANYAPYSITNVIVNNTADRIVLTDAASGNDFYCPRAFTAKKISYKHNYVMTTGIGESRGWETIALPFDVQKITHSSKGEITPFVNWRSGDSKKPFWLMTYGTGGWTDASSIKANTPYIISMPNHQDYKSEFRLNGSITFYAENATVKKSDDYQSGRYNGNTFVPNFANTDNRGYYALNVNNDYVTYSGGSAEGSRFVVNLRPVHPFEAYMTSSSSYVRSIVVSDDMTTGIEDIAVLIDESRGIRVYNMKGQLVIAEKDQSLEEVKKRLPAGVYIVNGKKTIIR